MTAAPPALSDLQAQVYAEARAARPVDRLMVWLIDRRNLAAAWQRVRSAPGADTPGPDGVTCRSLGDRAGAWLARLADDLLHGRYRPQPPRWLEVPKPGRPGAVRRIGILAVRDRVAHAGLKQVLEPVLDPVFLPTSFGFRPGRSVPGALDEALRRLTGLPGRPAPFRVGAHLDVADCFDTVDHAYLRMLLAAHVADPALTALLGELLAAGGRTTGRLWWRRSAGLVQGSALSPLLCNLALHPLDLALADLGRAGGGDVALLRYADDLLLLARDAAAAGRAVDLVRGTLAAAGQRLRGRPAVRPLADGVPWLGVVLRPRRQPWADAPGFGCLVPDERIAAMLGRLAEMTAPPSDRIDPAAFNLARWIVSVNDQLRQWWQAYRFADNAAEVARALDEAARRRVADLLHAVTGTPYARLAATHRCRLPRGFWSWEVGGVRLTVLSSLAPHAPDRLTRRPDWLRAIPQSVPPPAAPPALPALAPPPPEPAAAPPAAAEPPAPPPEAR